MNRWDEAEALDVIVLKTLEKTSESGAPGHTDGYGQLSDNLKWPEEIEGSRRVRNKSIGSAQKSSERRASGHADEHGQFSSDV